jgi:hypothetical protein
VSGREPAGRGGARAGYETSWLFLRTLVALLVAAWVVVALFSPPDPLSFLVATAVLWLVGTVGAWWLVYLDGYAWLDAQSWYRPGLSASRALVLFLGIVLALKVAGTVAVDQYVSTLPGYGFVEPQFQPGGGPFDATETANGSATPTATATETPTPTPEETAAAGPGRRSGDVTPVRDRPYVYDLAVSVVALAVAYLAVYRGFVAWLLGVEES